MKQTIRFLILIVGIALCACNKQGEIMQTAEVAMVELSTDVNTMNSKDEKSDIQRQIIKEGDIRFEATNVEKTREVILQSVSDSKGYISEDKAYGYEEKIQYEMVIRVPAETFESLLDKISKNAQKLDSKNIKALDVTEEFIDIETRIKTKKELENRYKELLKQAKTVEDLLKIEKEIGVLRTDIESIEGRLKYLKDKVSLSTLTVVFYEKTSSSFGFNSKFTQAIHNGWTNILWFFIALTNLWAFLLIGLITIVVITWVKKRNKKKNKNK